MVYTLRLLSSKCSLFHNSNIFGSCIIYILFTGCAKIKKKIRRQTVKEKAAVCLNGDKNRKVDLILQIKLNKLI